jgi:hypothetical protein
MSEREEVSPLLLKQAVEAQHGGVATYVQAVPVTETFQGRTEWRGVVHVFELAGHAHAKRAYAWSTPTKGSLNRQFFTVLHAGVVHSPLSAVRAILVAERLTQSNPPKG